MSLYCIFIDLVQLKNVDIGLVNSLPSAMDYVGIVLNVTNAHVNGRLRTGKDPLMALKADVTARLAMVEGEWGVMSECSM